MDYFVTEKTEVLREFAASIIAKLSKYMIKNNISIKDENNEAAVTLNETYRSSESLVSSEYTMDELKEIENKLASIKECVDRIVNNDRDELTASD